MKMFVIAAFFVAAVGASGASVAHANTVAIANDTPVPDQAISACHNSRTSRYYNGSC
jgi:hypothetical protein